MDVREKLVELLDESEEWADHKCDELDCETCPANKMKGNCVQQLMVDRLISNGVTVQEWISVKDRLPDNICPVLVVLEGISTAFNGWYHDGKWWTVGAGTRPFTQKVTHWMPLPQPPKGE